MKPKDVIRATELYCSVNLSNINSKRVTSSVAHAMQLAAYVLSNECGLSNPEIGDLFNRHPSSIHQALKRFSAEIDTHQKDIDQVIENAINGPQKTIWEAIENENNTWEQRYYLLKGYVLSGSVR